MNLWDLGEEQTAIIDFVLDDSAHSFNKITEMGFSKNSKVTCLQKTFLNGPRVYEVDGKIYSLCGQGAQKVILKNM